MVADIARFLDAQIRFLENYLNSKPKPWSSTPIPRTPNVNRHLPATTDMRIYAQNLLL
jgi:hypothetical protein